MGANDTRVSYKRWFVFSQPLRLLVALSGFVVAAIELLQTGDCQVGNWQVNCQHSSLIAVATEPSRRFRYVVAMAAERSRLDGSVVCELQNRQLLTVP